VGPHALQMALHDRPKGAFATSQAAQLLAIVGELDDKSARTVLQRLEMEQPLGQGIISRIPDQSLIRRAVVPDRAAEEVPSQLAFGDLDRHWQGYRLGQYWHRGSPPVVADAATGCLTVT
jgi:hypothetical protein